MTKKELESQWFPSPLGDYLIQPAADLMMIGKELRNWFPSPSGDYLI